MSPSKRLTQILTDPARAAGLTPAEWQAVLTCAHGESLLGTLAVRLEGSDVPLAVQRVLTNARGETAYGHVRADWEINRMAAAMQGFEGKVILLKGSAYLAAGLPPIAGRQIGDLDILVARDTLDEVERRLLDAEWEWVKQDPYDDAYYRQWMHELPPLIHVDRDRMIDVHHTILPLTAKPTPDAGAMIADAVKILPLRGRGTAQRWRGHGVNDMAAAIPQSIPLSFRGGDEGVGPSSNRPPSQPSPLKEGGLYILAPTDMICHAAAHMFADGDLEGGLRNLWDMDRLLRQFSERDTGFWGALAERAALHQLTPAVTRAVRLAHQVYETPVPEDYRTKKASDALYIRRIMARDGWGRAVNKPTRFAFYVRSHWLRMPPAMLARHLWTKWRKRKAG